VRVNRRRFLVSLTLPALIAVLGAGVAVARVQDRTNVRTVGADTFEANALIMSTLRFEPGTLTVASGDTIRFIHDDETFQPHTVSFVLKGNLPTNADEVFACQAPGEVCDDFLVGHFGGGANRLEDDDDGEFGIDAQGDSLLLLGPGSALSAEVTAPNGTNLYYLCAVHPWMQGKIRVEA
jgi:plastocyanin